MESSWNLLNHPPAQGSWNMAVDQYLMEQGGSTIRFYQWNPPALSLGYFQKTAEFHREPLNEQGIHLVRRLTGGKAVLHQYELTYSISCDSKVFPGELLESYRAIGLALINGLELLGVKAELIERKPRHLEGGNCFQVPGWYEVVYQGKKLIGSAQTRRKGRLLQHGSLLMDRDDTLIRKIFAHSPEEDLGMLSLKEILKKTPPADEIRKALAEGFTKSWNISLTESELNEESSEVIQSIERERFANPRWTLRR